MSNRMAPQSLKNIMKRCSSLGRNGAEDRRLPPCDVPKGHFAVYVGANKIRYVVPISLLSHPEFQNLLQISEEEFGFNPAIPITIPCEEVVFKTLTAAIR